MKHRDKLMFFRFLLGITLEAFLMNTELSLTRVDLISVFTAVYGFPCLSLFMIFRCLLLTCTDNYSELLPNLKNVINEAYIAISKNIKCYIR